MAESKSWTPDQLAAHIKEICGAVVAERLEPLQRTVSDAKSWIDGAQATAARPSNLPAEKGVAFGGVIAALAAKKGDLNEALKFAKEIKLSDGVIKALEASSISGGGVLIPTDVSSDFIDLLTARSVVRALGATTVQMTTGQLQIPKLNSATSANYIGENQQPTKSQNTFGLKKLTAKKLGALVPISNDLLRRAGGSVSTLVRNDVLRSVSLKEDVTFLRSQGGDYMPKGLKYWAPVANQLTAQGSPTLVKVTQDLGAMVLALEEANVGFSNVGWVFAPRTKQGLMTIRDTNGNFAFRDELLRGTLWGYPFRTTTQVPRNLGSGSDSEIYLVDFNDVIIGDTMGVEVAVSNEASYTDENGTLVSAFALDQQVMRVLTEHDLIARYEESICVMAGVTWSPTSWS